MAVNHNALYGGLGQSSQSSNSVFQPQQFFPQPQGGLYMINNSLEVANVPVGAGISAALCMSESSLYLKSLQNGQPIFMAYKLVPYDNKEQSQKSDVMVALIEDFKTYTKKVDELEKIVARRGGSLSELI